MKIFCFFCICVTYLSWCSSLFVVASNSPTVKPNYAEKLQNWLDNQKQLDCQQFDADLIECFAYNLFLKNAALFRDLDDESILVKPILTKHFENKTVLTGTNVTFTCETQIDALPLFLFYKLNNTIISEYNSKNANFILNKYAHALQARSDDETTSTDLNDYKSIDPKHIRLERRVHSIDSNKDNLADLETINLNIFNVRSVDSGYYLCIVANSIKSFRVTYAYLSVISPHVITSTRIGNKQVDYVELITDGTKFNWDINNSYILLGLLLAAVFFLTCFSMFICFCCMRLSQSNKQISNQELVVNHQIKDVKPTSLTITSIDSSSKVNTIIEKTMNSMKNNFIYVPMPPTPNDSLDENKLNFTVNVSKTIDEASNSNELEFSREKLKLGKLIEDGTFNRVYLADAYGIIPGRYKTVVCVKMLKDNVSKIQSDNFIKEMELMHMIGKHENVISLLGCCTTRSGPIYAIIEHAKYGSLKNYLRLNRPKDMLCSDQDTDQSQNEEDLNQDDDSNNQNETTNLDVDDRETAFKSILKLQKQLNTFKTNNRFFTSSGLIQSPCMSYANNKMTNNFNQTNLIVDLIRFCTQISNGMKYLHSKNVYHRELCARNILLNEFKIAKIADVGLSRDFYNSKPNTHLNLKCMAPEVLTEDCICANSDQWSFGVLMWEIFTLGRNPYTSIPVISLYDYLKDGNRLIKPIYCDDELFEIMLDCWQFKPEMRPTFANINDRLNQILDKYERKKIEQIATVNTPIKSLTRLETPTRLNLLTNKLNSPTCKLISSRQSESEDSQYFSGTDTSLVYADSCVPSSSNSSCNFSTMSPVSCYSNNYSVLPSNNAAAVRAASLMAASLAQSPPSPPPLKPLSRLLNVASAAYDL